MTSGTKPKSRACCTRPKHVPGKSETCFPVPANAWLMLRKSCPIGHDNAIFSRLDFCNFKHRIFWFLCGSPKRGPGAGQGAEPFSDSLLAGKTWWICFIAKGYFIVEFYFLGNEWPKCEGWPTGWYGAPLERRKVNWHVRAAMQLKEAKKQTRSESSPRVCLEQSRPNQIAVRVSKSWRTEMSLSPGW